METIVEEIKQLCAKWVETPPTYEELQRLDVLRETLDKTTDYLAVVKGREYGVTLAMVELWIYRKRTREDTGPREDLVRETYLRKEFF